MNKMVKVTLLDFSPRKPYNMQSYMCVKSLVCLDVYKKADIVRRPKQREGWELKKWETWKRKLGKIADMRSCVHTREHGLLEITETMDEICQVLQDKHPDLAERVHTELNQVLKHKPYNPDEPRSIRRLNWVGQKQEKGKLIARSSKVDQMIKAVKQVQDNISSIMRKYMLDQGISAVDVYSSDGHGKENEEERPTLALFI